ncbi:deoxyUTP pyrophosphatase [Nannizzia gypsea CBS 118893]|uniref:DeoxyUTP pyrophosphatase n=1 Tax=Arthroderma gypseum (strain ATCC MYA-4604 / CBS 118893) TaxID=535722 RepID=E4US51_ARTGP|nr:deoxyUTP pyrophosphatase [Nannizzia gypsea CBS 118893]EFR00469.1 deoxyUTP pyrophosphatase [Nannizzia gypsea CBS 118893]
MILSGCEVVSRQLVRNLQQVIQQQQPCGVDLTLRQISNWASAATIDDDNSNLQNPQNCIASVFPRSSLWRPGVSINAGVVDAGYEGAVGALLVVMNPNGIVLHTNAKLAQIVFEEMGYNTAASTSSQQVALDATG